MSLDSAPVIVVGGGPSGLAAAMELAHHGVGVIVVEPRTEVTHTRPRAKTTNARTLELFRRWPGVNPRIRERAPLKVEWSKDVVFCTTLTGREITRIGNVFGLALDEDTSPETGQQIPQPILEEVLREALAGSPRVRLMFAWRATAVQQGSDGARVMVESDAGEVAVLEAAYVIGADGPRSVVRSALGAKFEGASLARPNISVTFDAPGLEDLVPMGDAVQYWVLNPASPGILGRLDLRGRWWAINTAGADAAAIAEADPEAAVHSLLGVNYPIDVVAVDPWVVRVLVADRYRNNRLFIAGDAAHMNPPWGGHGFNTGVGDAVNLGWKIAAVLNGWAPDELLDSYESERRPIAQQFVADAAENGKTGPTQLASDEIMGDQQTFDRVRGAAAAAIEETKRIEFRSEGLVLGVGYGPESAAQSSDGTDFVPIAAVGNRLPHRRLLDGTSLYDLLGPELTLIGGSEDAEELMRDAAARHIPLTLLDVPGEGLQDFFSSRLVLVRPDQHIAWVGDDAPSALAGQILDDARRGVQTARIIPTMK
ncbi:FAD-dependent monooxygenase [Agreia sp.]|uniref:FAD-dependent monooxygenase n=1 Tax=Agreia sp. TaxID=1872416 RepID=UPI0035BBCC71